MLSPEIAEEITERTDGVPLFVEELTKAVIENGASRRPQRCPPCRIQRCRCPRPCTLRSWRGLTGWDRSPRTLPKPAQRSAGSSATGCWRPSPIYRSSNFTTVWIGSPTPACYSSGARRPPSTYIFKHVLVQDAAYGTLLRSRRQRLHGRIVETLEDRFSEIVLAQPALLAQHCVEAGLAEKAVAYWLNAGRQALTRSAKAEAVAQLRKGLEGLGGLPDSPWRRQQELDLLIVLQGGIICGEGPSSAPEVGETIARARALAEEIGHPEHIVSLLEGQWHFHLGRSEQGRDSPAW